MTAPDKLALAFAHLPDLLSPKEAAQVLGMKVSSIYSMKYQQRLPGVIRLSQKSFRVEKAVLLDWLRQKRVPSSGV